MIDEKPLASVHYIYNGEERTRDIYTNHELDRFTKKLKDSDVMFWTCLCSGEAKVPVMKLKGRENAENKAIPMQA